MDKFSTMAMKVRSFPETRDEPRKRILLIPPALIAIGLFFIWLHPSLAFIGTVLALAGVLTVFLVGIVFADLWVSSRRTKEIIKARKERMKNLQDEDEHSESDIDDPFLDSLDN